MLYHLPYYHAAIELTEDEAGAIDYALERTDDPPARFAASWQVGQSLARSEPGSLEFFLTERYCLFSEHDDNIYQARIHHRPWPLRSAELISLESTMIESHGLPTPKEDPHLHYCEQLSVDIWPLRRLTDNND